MKKSSLKATLFCLFTFCNQYGNFLDERFLFTNVKILSEAEIEKLLKK